MVQKGLGNIPVLFPFLELCYGTGVRKSRPFELWILHQKGLACQ